MNGTTAALTQLDRHDITRARELAALGGADAIRAHTGETDITAGLARAFGQAQHVLRELVAIIERLDGQPAAQVPEEKP